MIIEKLLFSHVGLAKAYAYNKKVEGLYRPGYFETLGNVILKRFLLLALVLDRAKSQSSLPLKHGIDGVDGGSPSLFISQSHIKSSRQVINDFLSSDVMHGEGNLLAHLVIVGYKVSYQQNPLFDYDFRKTDLFEDLQDGVRLCRAIQLLQHNSSVLMKLVVPSDTHKKNLVNCGIALQYLKQAGVPLCDEDGTMIEVEDIAHGDKELTLSLLGNMFVHLQAVCENYNFKIDSFTSLVDGKAMWCLLDYFSRKELHCSCSSYKVYFALLGFQIWANLHDSSKLKILIREEFGDLSVLFLSRATKVARIRYSNQKSRSILAIGSPLKFDFNP